MFMSCGDSSITNENNKYIIVGKLGIGKRNVFLLTKLVSKKWTIRSYFYIMYQVIRNGFDYVFVFFTRE